MSRWPPPAAIVPEQFARTRERHCSCANGADDVHLDIRTMFKLSDIESVTIILLICLQPNHAHTPKNFTTEDVIFQVPSAHQDMAMQLQGPVQPLRLAKMPDLEEAEQAEVVFVPGLREEDIGRQRRVNNDGLNPFQGKSGRKSDTILLSNDPNQPLKKDILFVPGKNGKERLKLKPKVKPEDKPKIAEHNYIQTNCRNLTCSRVLAPVCGTKREHAMNKYRLFENECFFRKVNCDFSYVENRYREVPLKRCDKIATHEYRNHPRTQPMYFSNRRSARDSPEKKETNKSNKTKVESLRRSLTMDSTGLPCNHNCPISCTDVYKPECGISASGKQKIFLNHCLLDYEACTENEAWIVRPLMVCAGEKVAMQENAKFMNMLQRFGVINLRGHILKQL